MCVLPKARFIDDARDEAVRPSPPGRAGAARLARRIAVAASAAAVSSAARRVAEAGDDAPSRHSPSKMWRTRSLRDQREAGRRTPRRAVRTATPALVERRCGREQVRLSRQVVASTDTIDEPHLAAQAQATRPQHSGRAALVASAETARRPASTCSAWRRAPSRGRLVAACPRRAGAAAPVSPSLGANRRVSS